MIKGDLTMKKICLFMSIFIIIFLCGCTYPYKNVKRVGSIKIGTLDGVRCVIDWNQKNESNVDITTDLNVEVILENVFYYRNWNDDGTIKPDITINDFTICNTVSRIDSSFEHIVIRNFYYDGSLEEYNHFLQWGGIKCAKRAQNIYILNIEGEYVHNNKNYVKL